MSNTRGTVAAIALRPRRDVDVVLVDEALAVVARGLKGDRRMKRAAGGKRQVTLIAVSDLVAASEALGRQIVHAATRRNILVDGLSFATRTTGRLRCGDVVFALRGPCDPCGRMDKSIGEGAEAALARRAGVVAEIVVGGMVRVGDDVRFVDDEV